MVAEKNIHICGKDVKMRYCAAAETGYERLTGKSSGIFVPIVEKDEDGNVKNITTQAKTDDCITLGVTAIVAAYAKDKKETPITADDILYDATPEEIQALIMGVIELRNKWYEIPATVNLDDGKKKKNEGDPKNAQTPTKRIKRA